jgi:DNA mismatch repair protein MutL
MVEIAGTRVFKQESIQCDIGTAFLIKNLFFNVPARRRFLKSDNVEKSHILNEFYRIALVNSTVAFSFYDGDEEIFQLPVSNNKVRIENIFGKNSKKRWQQQLLSIETSTNLANIYGYVGKPEFAQKSAIQYFFVNGRYMQHPYFRKAVQLAYNQMIQATESPNFFIYFDVDPQTIDVNIHPTKTEIKFENEQAIWSILSATVKEALGKFNIIPSIDFDQEGSLDIPSTMSVENVRPPQTNFNPDYNPFGASNYKRPVLDWEKLYGGFESKDTSIESSPTWQPDISFENVQNIDASQQQFLEQNDSRADNFQYKNRYIITSVKSGMLMIDQHRAHIRILFDQFISQIENRKALSQQVLFPEILELSADDELFFHQMMPDLHFIGFEFDELGNHAFNVKGVPDQIGGGSVIDLLLTMLDNAKTTAENLTVTMHESIALSLAEASALKSGQRLTNEEMNDLIERLFCCSNHNVTPDGKKIMTIFTGDEIEKRF